MKPIIAEDWRKLLKGEFEKEYFLKIISFLEEEKEAGKTIYPKEDSIFSAFNFCRFELLKVVVIGQDPYHQPEQASGLAFSVPENIKIPPSLRNVFKELNADVGIRIPSNGNLESWAKQGVLLLNMHLTVEAGKPLSHKNIGWKTFVEAVLNLISEKKENLVFVLWGKEAQKMENFIDGQKHLVIKSSHPSPLGARHGFLGSRPFSKINDYLKTKHKAEIDWTIN